VAQPIAPDCAFAMPGPVQNESGPSAHIAITMAERNNGLLPLHRKPATRCQRTICSWRFISAKGSAPLCGKDQLPQGSVRPNDLVAAFNVMVFSELFDVSRRVTKA